MSYTLYQGDCLEILPTLEANSIDAIITDLPYGTTACKWDSIIPFAPMWAEVKRILKPRGVFVTTASQPFVTALIASNLEHFKYELIWDKGRGVAPGTAKYRPLPAHESILIFASGPTIYNPQMQEGEPYSRRSGNQKGHFEGLRGGYVSTSNGERYPLSVIRLPYSPTITEHNCQKPVALYEYLIRTYTNAGDTVLDFTMGSGTTGVAAVREGRNFVGVELDKGYFAVAEKRITEAAMQLPLLEVQP